MGRKGGLLVAWNEDVQEKVIRCTGFCIEVQVTAENRKKQFWTTFVHASTYAKERTGQWEELKNKKQVWGDRWIIGGDFNDIKCHKKKK